MRPGAESYVNFSVHAAPQERGAGSTITVFGELDAATAGEVDAALLGAIRDEGPVVLDLRACTFVDSRGVAEIAKAALSLRELDRQLTIRGAKERVVRVLEVAGIADMPHVRIEPDGGAVH